MPKTVFMFSGQGSQYFQMGRELFDHHPRFAAHMREVDEMVLALTGRSVIAEVYGNRQRGDLFDDLSVTHPAIFMVEYALAQVLMESGITPDLTLGSSLGSAAACVIAGQWELSQALTLVVRHAGWVVAHCPPGGMVGVLAGASIQQTGLLATHTVVASYNGPSHVVLSMQASWLDSTEAILKSLNVPYSRLPVRYAFHSPWLMDERLAASSRVSSPQGVPGRIPVACCAHADVLTTLPDEYFWHVTLKPIDFQRTIERLEAQGPHRYVDLSPSSTLATLLKYLLPADSPSQVHRLLTPFGKDLAALDTLIQML